MHVLAHLINEHFPSVLRLEEEIQSLNAAIQAGISSWDHQFSMFDSDMNKALAEMSVWDAEVKQKRESGSIKAFRQSFEQYDAERKALRALKAKVEAKAPGVLQHFGESSDQEFGEFLSVVSGAFSFAPAPPLPQCTPRLQVAQVKMSLEKAMSENTAAEEKRKRVQRAEAARQERAAALKARRAVSTQEEAAKSMKPALTLRDSTSSRKAPTSKPPLNRAPTSRRVLGLATLALNSGRRPEGGASSNDVQTKPTQGEEGSTPSTRKSLFAL